jgi:anti-sigma factor RsiW
MNCDDVSSLAPLFLSRELDPGRREAIAEHLRTCAHCNREIAEQTALDQLIHDSVFAEQADVSRVEQNVRRAMRSGSRPRVLAAVAVAAVVLLAFAGYWVLLSSRAGAIFSAAARDHRREIVQAQPRKWQTDQAAIERLAAGQGLSPAAIASIAPAGYRLDQGRLCFLNGRLFVHLLYSNSSGNFSLFLREQETPHFRAAGPGAYASEHVAGFQKAALTALVVTEESNEAAMHLANSIASAL